MFVCLFVWNLYKSTFLHWSPPWSGGGRRVCMDPKFSTFQPFSPSFLRASANYTTEDGCRVPITEQMMAAGARVLRQRYIYDSSWSWSNIMHSYCNCVAPWVMHKHVETWTESMCVETTMWSDWMQVNKELQLYNNNKPDETGSKWIKSCNYTNKNIQHI
jgi:hypothetical protein